MSHGWWCSDDVTVMSWIMPQCHSSMYVMNMQLCASRRHDWLQQYANAKSLHKLLQTFASSAAFILFYFTHAIGIGPSQQSNFMSPR